uniref:Ig-like domain-containing protein n=1 Tax=Fundulus heteroclitus TaxID=8078 RepID=A0A3Q2Q4Y9_FUNHE
QSNLIKPILEPCCSFMSSSLTSLLCVVFSPAGQRIIRAEPGDNVNLTCRAAENKDVIVVEWSRTDLESDHYVLLYRDSQFDAEGQSPSFRNRVDLLDVKNGDVSLVLKNVTTHDTGTYECRVIQRGNNHRKRSLLESEPISTFNLRVEPGGSVCGSEAPHSKLIFILIYYSLFGITFILFAILFCLFLLQPSLVPLINFLNVSPVNIGFIFIMSLLFFFWQPTVNLLVFFGSLFCVMIKKPIQFNSILFI